MSSPIALVTDSTCDLPDTFLEQYAIQVVPHYVIWGRQEFRDRVNLRPEDFYSRLESDPTRPTSAQATAADFAAAYRAALELGAGQIVTLTVSSAMSGAYQSACMAAEQVKVPVQVIDSKGPTFSLGWQVLAAARARQAGGGVAEMVAAAGQVRQRLVLVVGMDTLEYLQRGGRIGGAARWLGTALQIRPIVSINHVSGLVEPVGLTRTHRSMVDMVYRTFFEKLANGGALHVAVLHGSAPQEAAALAERVRSEYNPGELLVNITGPVLGINTGPGALALSGYRE